MGARLTGVSQAYARVIACPGYLPLWLGQLISNFGDTLHCIALVVLVFQLTVLTMAHRLATGREADRVIVLERGRIVEQGTPEQLVAEGGQFAAALLQLEVSGWDWRSVRSDSDGGDPP
jgi:hypothetical protein